MTALSIELIELLKSSLTILALSLSPAQVCVLDIDVQGVKTLKQQIITNPKLAQLFSNSKFVFVAPINIDLLESRLRRRGTDDLESRSERLANARSGVEFGVAP